MKTKTDSTKMFSPALFVCCFVLVLTSHVQATHIRTGNVTTEGQVETNEGMRYYSTDAILEKPVVCWEDLAEDGITVDQCNSHKIRYVGRIDEDDFQKGNVLTFPHEDYVRFGCPLPPHSPKEKDSGVIFRVIRSVKVEEGRITAYTRFIDPGKVVPTIMLHMGPLVHSSRQTLRDTDLSLSAVSRVNNIGVRNFKRDGSATLFTGVSIAYSISASGGVCNFRFDVRSRRVTWEQRVDVQGSATLTGTAAFSRSGSNEIFKVGIPGAGFSLNVFLLGRVRAGFTAALNWEADLDLGAAATVRFQSGFVVARRIELGIGTLSNRPITSSNSASSASLTFGRSLAAAATAEGFAGIRPVLALELELPIIPDANVGLGATFGLKTSISAREPPFPAVTSGTRLGSACSTCHTVQGLLDVEGRRLSIEAEAPILGDREFVIVNTLFSSRIGTLCLFSRSCPASGTLPSAPTAPPATLPPTTRTVAPTRLPPPSCPCRCTFSGSAAVSCFRRSGCRLRGCGFLRSQCCN